MPFGFADTFSVEPIADTWSNVWAKATDDWQNDEELKEAFGVELTRHDKPFQAALAIFSETGKALWIAQYWLADPIVLRAKSAHNAAEKSKLLDKDMLALKLLAFAEEKDLSQRFYVVEAKDRLAAYKLYAEIQGFIGNKIDINASTNTINNVMQIKFVKPEPQEDTKIVEASSDDNQAEAKLPINLKLVSAR